MSERLVVVHPTQQVLAHAVAARFLTAILDKQSVEAPVHVALTGGTVGIATLAEAQKSPIAQAIDWSLVHLWWGDERFLPEGDKDRNEVQAREAWLDSIDGLPSANIHFMPRATPNYSVEDAALDYAVELAKFASDGSNTPKFAVVLLGMGPDAHVASLFPEHADAEQDGAPAIPVRNSPKPPSERISLTFEAIQDAEEVWIIAAGSEKAQAVADGLSGVDRSKAPVSAAQGRLRTLWLIDAAAASNPQ